MKLIFSKTRIAIVIVACMFVSGCKEVVYSNLVENEANNMVAVLAASGIAASRSVDSKGVYSLKVESAEVATAIVLLKARGYPTQQFESLGEVFSAQGIIGTPFEQHVRYIHAMNQELSQTISEIAGVRSARVLVTTPVKGRYDREEPRARASVTINHDPGFERSANLSKIKLLVAYAMNNLAYDDVAVAMFEADDPELAVLPEVGVRPVSQSFLLGFSGAGDGWLAGGKGYIALGLAGFVMLVLGVFLYRNPNSGQR